MPNNYDNVKNNSCLRKTRLQLLFYHIFSKMTTLILASYDTHIL